MLENPLQETAEDRRMAAREGQLDKKTFAQEQVTFTAPVSSDPRVGIIGGGMAGLACALSLDKRGVKSTVFDTVCHLSGFLAFFFFFSVFLCFNYLFNMVRLCLYLRVYACIMVM